MTTVADEPLCRNCKHPEVDHQRPGMCVGLGAEKVMTGALCPCPGFVPPEKSEHQQSYSTWTPPTDSTGSAGFTQTSTRLALGERNAPRPYLQRKRTVHGATPDWVMFGVDNPDGTVTVFASTLLSYLNLSQDEGHFDTVFRDQIRSGRIRPTPWDIQGRMVDYVEATARTYAEAVQMLFTQGWRADPEPSTADLQRQAALEEACREAELAADAPKALGTTAGPGDDDDEIIDAEIVED